MSKERDDELIDLICKIFESKTSIVYFIRCNKFVKIGTSKGHFKNRLVNFQIGNPYELKLEWFILGGVKEEKQIHKKLEI